MENSTDNSQTIALFVGTHAEKINSLIQSGFFDVKNGTALCHFDTDGRIRKIEMNFITFKC